MEIKQFPEANKVLKADECNDLPVFSDGQQCISCWQPSKDDIARIVEGGPVWLHVLSGVTQPPVLLSTEYPFQISFNSSPGDPIRNLVKPESTGLQATAFEIGDDFVQYACTVEVWDYSTSPRRHVATVRFSRPTGAVLIVAPEHAKDDERVMRLARLTFEHFHLTHEHQRVVEEKNGPSN